MSASIRATAPGKLLLAGEYGVLAGGMAVCLAAGRHARAELTFLEGDRCTLHVANSDTRYAFERIADGLRWHDEPGPDGRVLERALGLLGSDLPRRAFEVELDSRAFYERAADGHRVKLGLGSSAAISTALAAVLESGKGRTPSVASALAVHRAFQGGSGSGIDVLTSAHGGVIAGRAGDAEDVIRLEWPDGLHVRPVWTGVPASTTALIERAESFAAADEERSDACMREINAATEGLLEAWRGGDAGPVLRALSTCVRASREYDAEAHIGIWSPEHCTLAELADEAGVGYKPSGAGGGDFGFGFAADEAACEAFAEAARYRGFRTPELALGVAGLEVTTR